MGNAERKSQLLNHSTSQLFSSASLREIFFLLHAKSTKDTKGATLKAGCETLNVRRNFSTIQLLNFSPLRLCEKFSFCYTQRAPRIQRAKRLKLDAKR